MKQQHPKRHIELPFGVLALCQKTYVKLYLRLLIQPHGKQFFLDHCPFSIHQNPFSLWIILDELRQLLCAYVIIDGCFFYREKIFLIKWQGFLPVHSDVLFRCQITENRRLCCFSFHSKIVLSVSPSRSVLSVCAGLSSALLRSQIDDYRRILCLSCHCIVCWFKTFICIIENKTSNCRDNQRNAPFCDHLCNFDNLGKCNFGVLSDGKSLYFAAFCRYSPHANSLPWQMNSIFITSLYPFKMR